MRRDLFLFDGVSGQQIRQAVRKTKIYNWDAESAAAAVADFVFVLVCWDSSEAAEAGPASRQV